MDLTNSVQTVKLLLLAVLVVACSATDLRERRIPNAILEPALMAALFLGGLDGLHGLLDAFGGLIVGIGMLLPLHVLGRMGAGDVKMMGVVGSMLGAWGAVVAGLATMMAGAVLAVVYVMWIFFKPNIVACMSGIARFVTGPAQPSGDPTSLQTLRVTEIPYAVAIAAGTFATLVYLELLNGIIIT